MAEKPKEEVGSPSTALLPGFGKLVNVEISFNVDLV